MEIELAKTLFSERDGKLFWKALPGNDKYERRHNTERAGREAGSKALWSGYVYVTYRRKQYPAHRIVYLLKKGIWVEKLDHEDGNRANNRVTNLRPCSTSQNAQNEKLSVRNSSGVKGVSFDRKTGKYRVKVTKDRKEHHGGWFDDLNTAENAANTLRLNLHNEFRRNL